jgi:phosphatidylserine/phosphatidylglycerophosphate/cardiolipin synthase-like enzyme
VESFARALATSRHLRVIAVIPSLPNQNGGITLPMNLIGRIDALRLLHRAGGDRVAVYGLENHAGTPVYVHAKVCVIDDVWASIGSGNLNRRSWTHDSELSCAVIDETPDPREPRDPGGLGDGARTYARNLRLLLAREHLDRGEPADPDTPDPLCDPAETFHLFAASAAALDTWHQGGRQGDRPAGRLRTYSAPHLSPTTKALSTPLYRLIADPDGRPLPLRRHNTY